MVRHTNFCMSQINGLGITYAYNLLYIESVMKVKLWQPEGTVDLMTEEMSELASCPTLDNIIKEAM